MLVLKKKKRIRVQFGDKSECCCDCDRMFGVHPAAQIESLARALCPCADCGPFLLLRAARRRKSAPDLRRKSSKARRWSFRGGRKSGDVEPDEHDAAEFDFDFDAGGFEDWGADGAPSVRKVGRLPSCRRRHVAQ